MQMWRRWLSLLAMRYVTIFSCVLGSISCLHITNTKRLLFLGCSALKIKIDYNIEFFFQAPFSQRSANYGEIIGTAIGSFIVALILGNIMGLVCGVKYTRYQNKQQCKTSSDYNNDMNLNKGPLYEDIDKHVELSKNVSYDVVKIA